MEGNDVEHVEGQGSNPNGDPNFALERTLSRMMDYMERQESRMQQLEDRNGRRETNPSEVGDDVALERFQKFRPPRFNGEVGEEEAERWMETMTDIYSALHYDEERKVAFGAFQLEGPARAWWRIIEQKWEQSGTPRLWDTFLEEFRNKFIPVVTRERKEEEFISLKQRTMTVTEYEMTFTRLSKYAPEMVNTELKRRKRFMQGLNVEIQNALVSARLDTYAEAVEYAQRAETSLARLREFRNAKRTNPESWVASKKNTPQGQRVPQQEGIGDKRPADAGAMGTDKRRTPPVRCQYCGGGSHTENECWKKSGKCWACGSTEHQVKDCPQRRSGTPGLGRQGPQGLVRGPEKRPKY